MKKIFSNSTGCMHDGIPCRMRKQRTGTTTTSEAAPEASSAATATEAASDAAPESTAAAETTAAAEGAVASVDDLPGKSIGVQLGTTGDILHPITRNRFHNRALQQRKRRYPGASAGKD